MTRSHSLLLVCFVLGNVLAAGGLQRCARAVTPMLGKMPLVFADDFEQGFEHWIPSDAKLAKSVWQIGQAESEGKSNHFFRVGGKSDYQPPHRSPHSVALLKDVVVSSFELTARVQNTNIAAGGHRDLCFFWGYQDPEHFYYVHLGTVPDPHSSQIFIVNGADRTKISQNESPGIPWGEGWHQVKVRYEADSGRAEVFFDDMETPVLVAEDKTFGWGRVGLGTFDDHGNFDDVQLHGQRLDPIPAEAKLP